jgi:hypothetical protein
VGAPTLRLEGLYRAPDLVDLFAGLPRVHTHAGLQQPGAPILLEAGAPGEPGYRYAWSNTDLSKLDAEIRSLAALRQHLIALNLW